MIRRISATPGEKRAQYHRNLARAAGSVPATRVSVRNTDSVSLTGSARRAEAICRKSSGGRPLAGRRGHAAGISAPEASRAVTAASS
jgi:hypothetical protein